MPEKTKTGQHPKYPTLYGVIKSDPTDSEFSAPRIPVDFVG